jgi:MHS family proline/betaine transporter-like MFS transporter
VGSTVSGTQQEVAAGALGAAAAASSLRVPGRLALAAALIGNTLEWYDFAVYGFLATTIAKLFFPARDPTVSFLLAVATFGVGFVMRPLGAVFFGSMADRRGRKVALSNTILLMALGSALIAAAPTYEACGGWAPGLVALARLIQGLSAGGETGSVTALLLEYAPPRRRGFFTSLQQATVAASLLLGSLLGAFISHALSQEAFEAWGWRVPFLLGAVIGPVGLYIRRRAPEPDEFLGRVGAQSTRTAAPLTEAVSQHGRSILLGFGIALLWTVCTYFFLVYMPSYAIRELRFSQPQALAANAVALTVLTALVPAFGLLSDRIGSRPLLMLFAAALFGVTYPGLWALAARPTFAALTLTQIAFAVLIAGYTGAAPRAIAELYPPHVRSSAISIAYNFPVTVFGGFAPFIATALIARTGDALSPAYYVMAAAALSLLAAAGARSRRG